MALWNWSVSVMAQLNRVSLFSCNRRFFGGSHSRLMAAPPCNQITGLFWISLLLHLACSIYLVASRWFLLLHSSSVPREKGEGQITHVSYFSFKKHSQKPQPVTPCTSHWLTFVTWSTLAARESGKLCVLSRAHWYPEGHVSCSEGNRENGWLAVSATPAYLSNLPSLVLCCHLTPWLLISSSSLFPVAPTKCYNFPRQPGCTLVIPVLQQNSYFLR